MLIWGAAAGAVLVWWMTDEGGFSPTTWYPGALILLALLFLALLVTPARPTRPVLVATGLLFAYAAWSCLSIAWAGQKGIAWDGANRTVLYAAVFALFALWPLRARPATVLVAAFALAVAGIGLAELLSVAPREPDFIVSRLSEPMGYTNADVALWMMGLWPCVALGARRELSPWLRALLLASAVLLAGLALLGQSRGWLWVTPAVAVILIAFSRDRIRVALAILAVAAASMIFRAPVVHVYTALVNRSHVQSALDDATRAILLAALALGVAVLIAAYLDRRVRISARLARSANRGFVIAGVIAVAFVGIALAASAGHPFARFHHAFEQFKNGPQPTGTGSRITESLGGFRYDFWRVAWHEFVGHPLAGIGADNFQEPYLRLRSGYAEPLYPHSTELRALSQTGIVGAGLLGGALAAALLSAWRGARRRAGIGAATAAGATAAFAYWLLHGSIDWLWEFPALGGAAFALLGVAAALAPASAAAPRRLLTRHVAAIAGIGVCAVAAALSFASPWLARRKVDDAAATWPQRPAHAFAELRSAADFNPLSPDPMLVGATIALDLREPRAAARDFRAALRRDPENSYATFELAMIESNAGHRRAALRYVALTRHLDPRNAQLAFVTRKIESGERINIADINAAIRRDATQHLR